MVDSVNTRLDVDVGIAGSRVDLINAKKASFAVKLSLLYQFCHIFCSKLASAMRPVVEFEKLSNACAFTIGASDKRVNPDPALFGRKPLSMRIAGAQADTISNTI